MKKRVTPESETVTIKANEDHRQRRNLLLTIPMRYNAGSLCWNVKKRVSWKLCGGYRCKWRTSLEVGHHRIDIIRMPMDIPYVIAALGGIAHEARHVFHVIMKRKTLFYTSQPCTFTNPLCLKRDNIVTLNCTVSEQFI